MLQRIQSVWMLLAAVCTALTFKFSFFSGNVKVGTDGHVFRRLTAVPNYINGANGSTLILIVTVILLAGILFNIFNYKARKKQLWLTVGLILLSLINIFLYWRASSVPDNYMEGSYNLTAVFVVAIPLLLFLAIRGIVRDEKLVKSTDRLR